MQLARYFLYFDPLESLDPEVRRRWLVAGEPQRIIREALRQAEFEVRDPAVSLSHAGYDR